jgi:hypothetical protein
MHDASEQDVPMIKTWVASVKALLSVSSHSRLMTCFMLQPGRSDLVCALMLLRGQACEDDSYDSTVLAKLAKDLADIFRCYYAHLPLSVEDVRDLIATSYIPDMFAVLTVILSKAVRDDGSVDTPLREPGDGPSFLNILFNTASYVFRDRFPAGTLLPVLQCLMDAGFQASPMPMQLTYIMRRHPDVLQYLLERGLDPNSTVGVRGHGATVSTFQAVMDHVMGEVVDWGVGGDGTHISAFQAALEWAIRGVVDWHVVALLLKHGASPVCTTSRVTGRLSLPVPPAIFVFLGPIACNWFAQLTDDADSGHNDWAPSSIIPCDVDALKNLLTIMPHVDAEATFMGSTLMQFAATHGSAPAVAALLEKARQHRDVCGCDAI